MEPSKYDGRQDERASQPPRASRLGQAGPAKWNLPICVADTPCPELADFHVSAWGEDGDHSQKAANASFVNRKRAPPRIRLTRDYASVLYAICLAVYVRKENGVKGTPRAIASRSHTTANGR